MMTQTTTHPGRDSRGQLRHGLQTAQRHDDSPQNMGRDALGFIAMIVVWSFVIWLLLGR